MANLNKVMLIGRLTRDPEQIAGGKGVKFGFAVNNRKLNPQSQQWEDEPVFIDCEMWNRNEGAQQATRLFETVKRGHQLFIEGRLKFDTWNDPPEKGGGKRSALRVVVETFQYLEARPDGEGAPRQYNQAPRQQPAPAAQRQPAAGAPAGGGYRQAPPAPPEDDYGPGGPSYDNNDIPF
jgi:single-strand DNA-binding protein